MKRNTKADSINPWVHIHTMCVHGVVVYISKRMGVRMTSNDPTRLALCPLRVGFIAKVPLSPLGIPTGRLNCEVTGTSDGHRTAGLVSPCCCLGVWTNREHLSHGGGQFRSSHLHRHSRNAGSTPNEAANKLICRLIIKISLFFYFLGAVHIVRSLCPYTT